MRGSGGSFAVVAPHVDVTLTDVVHVGEVQVTQLLAGMRRARRIERVQDFVVFDLLVVAVLLDPEELEIDSRCRVGYGVVGGETPAEIGSELLTPVGVVVQPAGAAKTFVIGR
jgi:hypothetical protein